MIDLHMHSKYSDGTDNIEDILKIAESKQLEYISITDHNTVDAYYELKKLEVGKYYSGKIIRGVELSTKVLGVPIEILSYGFDLDKMKKQLTKKYISVPKRNRIEVTRLFDKVIKNGLKIDKDALKNYKSDMYASKFIHENIVKYESNRKYIDDESFTNSNIFYRKYMSEPSSLFYINIDDLVPDIEEIYNIIKGSGGLVFIPHIFEYGKNSSKILDYLISNFKIDGIECYYTTFTKDQNKYLIDLCKKNNYFISGGSDYHGKFKKNVSMGIGFGNLKIPNDIVKNWLNKLDIE